MSTPTAGTATVPDDAHHLVDADGTNLGWTLLDPKALRAEPLVRHPNVDPQRLAGVAATDLAGMRIATSDQPLADALIEVGGTLDRHATVMTAFPSRPAATRLPPGLFESVPFTSLPHVRDVVARLADIRLAAYPPAHPDHEPSTANRHAARKAMKALIEGSVLGPLHPELSAIVREKNDDTHTHGAIIVTGAPPDAIWPGGPWIADLFIDPQQRSRHLGRRLVEHALHTSAELGLPRIGLAVTNTNTAIKLYRHLGFQDTLTSWAIHLPQVD